jgi:hypothetical protein
MTTISLILNNYGNFCYDFVLKNKFGQKHLGGKSLKLIFLWKIKNSFISHGDILKFRWFLTQPGGKSSGFGVYFGCFGPDIIIRFIFGQNILKGNVLKFKNLFRNFESLNWRKRYLEIKVILKPILQMAIWQIRFFGSILAVLIQIL